MKRTVWVGMVLVASATLVIVLSRDGRETATAPGSTGGELPTFEVDPDWPTIPDGWVLGQVASVAVDSRDHVWVLQRPRTLEPEEASMAAPSVLEFDPEGNFVQGWGGPSPDYPWPQSEHGIFVDYNDFVWVGGNGPEDQVLKFTMSGELVMQIGQPGESRGNRDPDNLGRPADTWVHRATNELFVADGYGNRRVIVYDADTGDFKRMWGAFGNEPTDGEADPAWAQEQEGPGPRNLPSRCTRQGYPTTGSSMSPTVGVSACRSSRSTGSMCRRCSSAANAWRRSAATARQRPARRSRRTPISVSSTSATAVKRG